MNDSSRDDKQAQPWHPADEKKADRGARKPSGVPIGTHSLTGGGASVGLPSSSPRAKDKAERSDEREAQPGAEEPDPLLEPRAGTGDLLGRR